MEDTHGPVLPLWPDLVNREAGMVTSHCHIDLVFPPVTQLPFTSPPVVQH